MTKKAIENEINDLTNALYYKRGETWHVREDLPLLERIMLFETIKTLKIAVKKYE
jgi:hypothetical protein